MAGQTIDPKTGKLVQPGSKKPKASDPSNLPPAYSGPIETDEQYAARVGKTVEQVRADRDAMLAARPVEMLGGAAGAGAGISSASAASNAGQADAIRKSQELASQMAADLASRQAAREGQARAEAARVAAQGARDALGPAPTIDMGLADRNVGRLDESLAANREVLDRILNAPSVADRLGKQTLRTQLALARSAAGGPGAVADALTQAQAQAPEIQAVATQGAIQEKQALLGTAGQVAGQITDAELGRRQQDIGIAAANQNSATTVLQEVARLTGTQLELDQRSQELIGQMARDFAAIDYNWAQLSVQQQDAYFDRLVTQYGIDKNFAAQMKAIAAQKSVGPLDIFNGVVGLIGGAASIGAAAAGKPG